MESRNRNIEQEEAKILSLLQQIKDPEIPVVSIVDLGIFRQLQLEPAAENGWKGRVTLTPTYSGCPAMDFILAQTRRALDDAGYKNLKVEIALSPAWTTDWISPQAKAELEAYGIAPPPPAAHTCSALGADTEAAIRCPRCQSYHTERISQFGSTPCKALYRCLECREPFDHFKCH